MRSSSFTTRTSFPSDVASSSSSSSSSNKLRLWSKMKKFALFVVELAVVCSLLGGSWVNPTLTFPTNQNHHDPPDSRGLRSQQELKAGAAAAAAAELPRADDQKTLYQFQRVPNATVALIHIGKTGGSSLKAMTALRCKQQYEVPRQRQRVGGGISRQLQHAAAAAKQQQCIDHYYPRIQSNNSSSNLPRQIRSYVHMHSFYPSELQQATTFLITLRNPVERLISAYRYNHPANCNAETRNAKITGCLIADSLQLQEEESSLLAKKFYRECFPSPGVEEFAQSLFAQTSTTPHDNKECQQLARDLVQGNNANELLALAPHFYYNYQYYASKTIERYPNKEILVIRTEHQALDLHNLDPNAFPLNDEQQQQGSNVKMITHGSEHYQPSPISTKAYHKLCCALASELNVYRTFVERAANLEKIAKQATLQDLEQKCGIVAVHHSNNNDNNNRNDTTSSFSSWENWVDSCERKK